MCNGFHGFPIDSFFSAKLFQTFAFDHSGVCFAYRRHALLKTHPTSPTFSPNLILYGTYLFFNNTLFSGCHVSADRHFKWSCTKSFRFFNFSLSWCQWQAIQKGKFMQTVDTSQLFFFLLSALQQRCHSAHFLAVWLLFHLMKLQLVESKCPQWYI